jgi:hypothetical protein
VSGGGWDCEHASALDLGELPAPHMEHPVVAVAEQDQVGKVGVALSGRLPWVLTRGRTSSH